MPLLTSHPQRFAPLVAGLLGALLAVGCGGSSGGSGGLSGLGGPTGPTGPSDPVRISRQELTDANGVVITSWSYAYATDGRLAEVLTYNATGVLQSSTAYGYAGELRTGATVTSATGTSTLSTATYTYEAGVLSRYDYYAPPGTLSTYMVYTFDQGLKVSSSRYNGSGVYLGRSDFDYGPSGQRTGGTSFDATGATTSTFTRTYVDGNFTQARFVATSTGAVSYRNLTYQPGTPFDVDRFYEF
jgi:hypothetical protein